MPKKVGLNQFKTVVQKGNERPPRHLQLSPYFLIFFFFLSLVPFPNARSRPCTGRRKVVANGDINSRRLIGIVPHHEDVTVSRMGSSLPFWPGIQPFGQDPGCMISPPRVARQCCSSGNERGLLHPGVCGTKGTQGIHLRVKQLGLCIAPGLGTPLFFFVLFCFFKRSCGG